MKFKSISAINNLWPSMGAALVLLACALFSPRPSLPVEGDLDRTIDKLDIGSSQETPQGELEIGIEYIGSFYLEVFGYSPEALNIKHLVLLVPEEVPLPVNSGQIFQSLLFTSPGADLEMRADRQEHAWSLDYLYEAPQGQLSVQVEPGTYSLAVAFIAAPINRDDAGIPDSTLLYPGVTGGGASTDFQEIVIERGVKRFEFTLMDSNGWACPWLYVYNGRDFERRMEILRNLRGEQNQGSETSPLGPAGVFDGEIILLLAEEKAEITFLDNLYLLVDGQKIGPEEAASLAKTDGDYVILAEGEELILHFPLPEHLAAREMVEVTVVATGYYLPLENHDPGIPFQN